MATLNSIRNVVGNYGSTAANQTITFGTSAVPVLTATAGSKIYLSVGDTLVITGDVSASGYAIGDEIVVSSVNYGTGVFIATAAAAPGIGAAVTATIKNRDTDLIASVGGSTISEPTDIITKECTSAQINGGVSRQLVNVSEIEDYANCSVMFILDSVTTTAGVAAPNAVFSLQLNNNDIVAGVPTAQAVPAETVLANMSAGDVFQTSSLSTDFWNLNAGAVATPSSFTLKNVSATNYLVTFRMVVAS